MGRGVSSSTPPPAWRLVGLSRARREERERRSRLSARVHLIAMGARSRYFLLPPDVENPGRVCFWR